MALYSDKVMDHFRNPRNVGIIDDADGVGEVGNPVCGDIMKIYLKIADNTITDVKFETFGCGSAIASSSMATELIKGKSLTDALALTNKAAVSYTHLDVYKRQIFAPPRSSVIFLAKYSRDGRPAYSFKSSVSSRLNASSFL